MMFCNRGRESGKGLFCDIKFASKRARIHAFGAYKQIWRSIFLNAVYVLFVELLNLTRANRVCEIFHGYATVLRGGYSVEVWVAGCR